MNTTKSLIAVLVLAISTLVVPCADGAQIDRIDPTLDGEVLTVEGVDGGSEGPQGASQSEPLAVPPTPRAPDPYDLQLDALERRFVEGVEAWRRGEYELARGRWLDVLNELGPGDANLRGRVRIFDRHALLHDLGNAAFRLDRPLEAVGWYLAALRHAPRNADTRANLRLARRAAELDDVASDDLADTLGEGFDLITPYEARWLALLALGPLLVALLGEAVRGGRAWGLAIVLGALVAAVGAAPLAHHLLDRDADPVLIVAEAPATLRAEPLPGRPAIGEIRPGAIAERIDALPDWVRLERADGVRGWVSRDVVFPLER